MNNRRDLLFALGAGALAAPFAAFAQQPGKIWRIGYLAQTSGPNENLGAFLDGLRTFGYIEGQNLSIDYRWSAGNRERLPAMAQTT